MSEKQIINQNLVLKVIQEYMGSNRYFKVSKIIPIIRDRFGKSSINISTEGIKEILRNLKNQNAIVEGSKLTRTKILQNPNRKKIYDFIKENPGINFNKVATTQKFSVFLVEWHLNMLIKFNYVRKKKIENFDAYYPIDYDNRYDEILHLLSREKCKEIVKYLLSHDEGCAKTQISESLEIHFKTISKYLDLLEKLGFIVIKKDLYQTFYFLKRGKLQKLENDTQFIFIDN